MNPPLSDTTIAAQTEAPQHAPTCPICQQADQVRTIQAAYDMGVERVAPPAMPVSNARMMPWIIAGGLIYLAGNFYLLVDLAANSRSAWPMGIQIGSDALCLVALLTGLVLSYLAIVRAGRAENDYSERFDAWDQATDTWRHLYYCLRDKAVIDPEQHVLSDADLRALLRTEQQAPREQHELFTHGDIHQPAAAHSPEPQETRS
jgi:hypothetical protein